MNFLLLLLLWKNTEQVLAICSCMGKNVYSLLFNCDVNKQWIMSIRFVGIYSTSRFSQRCFSISLSLLLSHAGWFQFASCVCLHSSKHIQIDVQMFFHRLIQQTIISWAYSSTLCRYSVLWAFCIKLNVPFSHEASSDNA